MSFLSSLKKLSLGGLVAQKLTGADKNSGSFALGVMDPHLPKKPEAVPFDPGSRIGSSINGQSGVDQPSQRLGWTNGGYTYHNSPFNGGGSPMSFAPPPRMGVPNPSTGAPFQGGGAPPPQMGGSAMTASGPQQMGLPPQGQGGSMPPAGAPPQGQPTMQLPQNPQLMQAMMLRNRGGMGAM